jgi:predicted esterase
VRIEFLIALTVVVAVFGIVNFASIGRKQREEARRVRIKRRARDTAREIHAAAQARLETMAMAAPGRIQRDAAALLAQLDESEGASIEALESIHANAERLKSDEPAVFPRGASFLRAYHALADDSFRPYSICVPKAYSDEFPVALVFVLHGHQGFKDGQAGKVPCYPGAITVRPEGRRASDYMYIGEDDVLSVLEDVTSIYNVDRGRVYLTGGSMGGTGCWNLAVHYPDLFAGIAPVAANADHQAWEQLWGWNPEEPHTHGQLRVFLHASFSPFSYAENLEHCRVVVTHGTGDTVVPVQHARAMVSRLRDELGFAGVEYWELPQKGHGGFPAWTAEFALGKLFGAGPAVTPSRFTYKTASLRHNRAWWISIDRLGDPLNFSTVRTEAEGAHVEVTTENVSALTVLTDRTPERTRTMRIDGADFAIPPQWHELGKGRFSVEKWNGQWRPATASGPLKKRGCSGPVSDVFRGRFMLVFGTQGDSELLKTVSRAEAERFAAEWKLRFGDPPPMRADKDVSRAELKACSLVLFGGASVNSVSEAAAPGLPIQVLDGAIAVGPKRYEDPDAGVLFCYPSPFSPEQMIVMAAGNTPGALYQAMDRFGLWFNWGVYDKYKWFDYAVYDARTAGPESFLEVGFFDNEWRLPTDRQSAAGGGAALTLDAAAAAQLAPQGFPRFMTVADANADDFVLSDLLPVRIDQYRGAVGFDRSYAGRPIRLGGTTFEKGLGVKAPSTVVFDLGGRYRSFRATVGLTHGFKGKPLPARVEVEQVIFEVWGDDGLLATSGPLSWKEDKESWTEIEADLTGVSTIKLVAQPKGGRTWLYGAGAWGAPTVAR